MNNDHASPLQHHDASAAWLTTPHATDGEMHERVRTHTWSATSLGAINTWPQSLRTAIATTLDGGFPMIVLWGPQLIQIYNDGYRDLMGTKHPSGLGLPTQVCWPEVWHLNAPIYARVWAGETVTLEDALYPITRHGTLEHAFFTLCYSPLRDETGAIAGVLVTVFETTTRLREAAQREAALQHALNERTRTEDALHVSEAQLQRLLAQEQAARKVIEDTSRLKDEFLATVSHELRTPLTAVLGYAEMLQRRTGDAAQVARIAGKVLQSAQAQATLIEDLLDLGQIVSGKLRIEPIPMQLIDVIRTTLDTVRPMVEAKGLQLETHLDPHGGLIRGDPNRLQQVVWNILTNATKFTPPGGHITMTLTQVETMAVLRVSDTGCGIPTALLPSIFDPFRQADSSSQRAYNGLGLGLAIVRQIVELHGGTVSAASAGAYHGATFTIHLPLVSEAQDVTALYTRPALPMDTAMLPLHGRQIVVVDDQPAILDLLTDMLLLDGGSVRACTSAAAALALIKADQPDVLLADIAMPEHDGYWLIDQVRQLAPTEGGTIPAVALTAYARIEDRVRVLAAGFQQYLRKPVSAAELRDTILDVITREPVL